MDDFSIDYFAAQQASSICGSTFCIHGYLERLHWSTYLSASSTNFYVGARLRVLSQQGWRYPMEPVDGGYDDCGSPGVGPVLLLSEAVHQRNFDYGN